MRGTMLVLGLVVAVSGNLGRAEGVSYSGNLSHSGANADGRLFVAGPDWDSSSVDATLSWTVDNVTMPGRWHYVYTLTVPPGDRRAGIQCVIIETAEAGGPPLNLSAPASAPENWLVAVQMGLFSTGSEQDLPRDLCGAEFRALTNDTTTLTLRFDSDRGPKWGDLYARSFMLCDVSNVLYNAGLLSLAPSEAPHSGSSDGHVLVPGAVPSVFLIPVPAAVFLGAMGVCGAGWLRRRRWL